MSRIFHLATRASTQTAETWHRGARFVIVIQASDYQARVCSALFTYLYYLLTSEPECTTMTYGSSYTINLESMEADCSVLAQTEAIELGSGCVCADDPVTISNGPGECGCTIIEDGGRVVTYIPPSNARLGTTCMHISDNPCDSLSSEEIDNVDASREEEALTAVEEGTVSTAVEEDEESTATQPESNEGVDFMSPSDEFLTDIPETATPASLEVDASKAASSELTGYLFVLVFVLV